MVDVTSENSTARHASFLSSIHSAPEPSSVTFSFAGRWATPSMFPSSGNWIVVDRWLARMVATRTTAKAGLMVVLARWPEDNPNWEGYFPEFRRDGGELRRETCGHNYCGQMIIFSVEDW